MSPGEVSSEVVSVDEQASKKHEETQVDENGFEVVNETPEFRATVDMEVQAKVDSNQPDARVEEGPDLLYRKTLEQEEYIKATAFLLCAGPTLTPPPHPPLRARFAARAATTSGVDLTFIRETAGMDARPQAGLLVPKGVRARQLRALESTMSKDPHKYVCEFCGEDFDTGSKKAGHISWYHRDDRQEEDLVAELQRLASEKEHPPEMSEMDTEGKYSRSTYLSHFGTWNDALRAAGLEVRRPTNVPKDQIIEAIQALADQLGHPPTVDEMNEHGKYSRKTASKRFGSWNDALRSAGFEPHNEEIPREDLLAEVHRLTEELGQVPAIADLDEYGRYSIKGFLREFGGWDAAITAAGYEPHTPFRGSDHPRWVGGKERDRLWYGPKWSQQRERAVQRDGYECQRPNCDHTRERHRNQYGRDLHVHHIVPLRSFKDEHGEIDYEQANALDNLITLCSEHHARWEQISPLQPDVRHS